MALDTNYACPQILGALRQAYAFDKMGYLYVSPGRVRETTQTQSTVSRGFSLRGAQSCLHQGAKIAFDYGFEKHAFSDAFSLR